MTNAMPVPGTSDGANGRDQTRLPIVYERMCTAIAECYKVDEVQQIREQARALEVYAQQMRNTDAERRAASIRIRAERRYGQIVAALERATPQQRSPNGRAGNNVTSFDAIPAPSPYAEALQRTGVSRQQAARMQALAAVSQEQFDEYMSDTETKPTTAGILAVRRARTGDDASAPRMSEQALWVWGRLRDFERDNVIGMDVRAALSTVTDSMIDDIKRTGPLVVDFITALVEIANEKR